MKINMKGVIVFEILTALVVTSAIAVGFYKTKQNGVLENNGKKIWCKMKNKGNQFCDNKYNMVVNP